MQRNPLESHVRVLQLRIEAAESAEKCACSSSPYLFPSLELDAWSVRSRWILLDFKRFKNPHHIIF